MTSEQRLEENPTCEGKDSSSMQGGGWCLRPRLGDVAVLGGQGPHAFLC